MSRALVISLLALSTSLGGVAGGASMNGSAGVMPAYYDGTLFTINFKELPSGGEAANLAHNGSINTIYMCDSCEGQLPGGGSFVSVIDAIQGDGFNPLWNEVQVAFKAGVTPRQLTSDTDVADAMNAGEITLTPTTEVYRCSVIGKPAP
jgi:hypothetical protein